MAVQAARSLLNLPYFVAEMSVLPNGNTIEYNSQREARSGAAASFSASYRPVGPASLASSGSLEYFLTERYCLYNLDHRGAPYRLEIHHLPWQLQPAEAAFKRNTMTDAAGVPLPHVQPLLHFSRRQDMVAWAPSAL